MPLGASRAYAPPLLMQAMSVLTWTMILDKLRPLLSSPPLKPPYITYHSLLPFLSFFVTITNWIFCNHVCSRHPPRQNLARYLAEVVCWRTHRRRQRQCRVYQRLPRRCRVFHNSFWWVHTSILRRIILTCTDVIGVMAFSTVKSDLLGNVKVHYLALSSFLLTFC